MSLSKVESALIAAFRSGAFFPDEQIAFENVKFDPPSNKPWVRLKFENSKTEVSTLGPIGYNTYTGHLLAHLYFPALSGRALAGATADAIQTYFKTGNKLTYGGQVTVIRRVHRARSFEGAKFYEMPVFIHFYAQITR